MAEVIDISNIPRRTCETCRWHDDRNGACTKPGGYKFDWKRWKCFSYQQKDRENEAKEGN